MATRAHRISEFIQTAPPSDLAVTVLCEDHNGTYVVPFACQWVDGNWVNAGSGQPIESRVVGWRAVR